MTNITACVRVTGHCCASSWGIKAKKCKKADEEFYVYYLRRPGGCFAYCAGMIFDKGKPHERLSAYEHLWVSPKSLQTNKKYKFSFVAAKK